MWQMRFFIDSLSSHVFWNNVSHPDSSPHHIPGSIHRSTILSDLGPDHALTVLFLGTHTRTSQGVTHPRNALTRTRLTSKFRWKPKARELPKSLVLVGDGYVHIRHRRSTPLRGPTSSLVHFRPGIGYDTKLSHPDPGSTTSRARLLRNTILSALGPDHALTVLFLGTHASRTSQWVTHPGNALA